jgi:quercetin dioxygenase-like cupin family protein
MEMSRMALRVGLSLAVIVLSTGGAWGQSGVKTTTVFQTSKTVIGQEVQFPLSRPQLTMLVIEIAPGGEVGRHMHPVPEVAYILEGTLTVVIEGHGEKVFTPGEGFIEVIHTWHNGFNRGSTPVKILAVFVGEEGKPNVIRP